MLGFCLAAIYAVAAIFGWEVQESTAILNGLNFLWWWHIVWTCIIFLPPLIMMLVGGIALGAREKAAGFMLLAAGPIFAVIFAVKQTLLLLGVYLLCRAGEAGMPLAEWDVKYAVCGGILLLIGTFCFRTSGGSSSSS